MSAALPSRRAILGAAMVAAAAPAAAAAPVDRHAGVDRAARALADAMGELHGERYMLTVDHEAGFILMLPRSHGGRA